MSGRGHVLVVEDDNELRAMFRTALVLDEFDVIEASSGLQALRRLESNIFDLIVLDMGLPALSGRSFLLELMAKADTRKIPVVIVTGSTKTVNSLNVGCVLRKPVSGDQLVEAVRHFVRRTAPFISQLQDRATPLYWTIWVALLLFAAGEFGRRRISVDGSPQPWAWWAFVAGALLCAIHIALAMKNAHAWSHEAAVAATARQTMAVYGVNWGGGVFVNYAFVAVWLLEAWRWRWRPAGEARVITWMTRVFFLVIILNGAVIFAGGTRRIAGAFLVAWLLWIWRPAGAAGPRAT